MFFVSGVRDITEREREDRKVKQRGGVKKKDQGRVEGIKHYGMHCVFYEWEIRTKELIRRAKEKGRKEEGKKKRKK